MKKFIIIVSVGISLIIIGSLITASEISSWTLYDFDENVANLNKAKLETEISFKDFETDNLVLIQYPMYGDDFSIDYDDNIVYFIGRLAHRNNMMNHSDMMGNRIHINMMSRGSNVNLVESNNQELGSIRVAYEYLDGFGSGRCELESLTVKESDGGYEYSRRQHNGKNRRNDYYTDSLDYDIEVDTTYLYVRCNNEDTYFNFNDIFSMGAKERIKTLLKNKQLPTPFGEFTIIVNPKDKGIISY